MHIAASILLFLVVSAALAVPVLPERLLPPRVREGLRRLGAACQRLALCGARRMRVQGAASLKRGLALVARLGFGVALLVFVTLSLRLGFLTHNEADSSLGVAAAGLAAVCMVGGAIYLGLAAWLMPAWARGQDLLRRMGLGGVWSEGPREWSRSLREAVEAHTRASKAVCILDVSGRDLLSRGPGPTGGLLLDALAANPSIPARILLLAPEVDALDPDQRRASVFQALLAELDSSAASYIQCLRATLAAVESLNTGRAPEAQVELRLYTEKPALRMALFDDAAIYSPWPARERTGESTWVEALRDSALPSLQEACRRQFARLWAAAAPPSEVRMSAAGSVRVAKGSSAQGSSRKPVEPKLAAMSVSS